MRLKGYLKGFFIFGLILFLGVMFPLSGTTTVAHADETREIKLNVNSQTLVKGKSFSIYVYNLAEGQTVTYLSSAPTIASVSDKGVVSANLVGEATILVTVYEGDSVITVLPCKITIGPPAISVQFSKLQITLEVGERYTLKRIVQPLITTEVPKFSSHNKEIATVSAGGRISAKDVGETYIFAQIDNGAFAVCKVIVIPEVEEEETVLPAAEDVVTEAPAETQTTETGSEAPAESTEEVVTDPLLTDVTGMDFETFMTRLNANGETADEAESATENAD